MTTAEIISILATGLGGLALAVLSWLWRRIEIAERRMEERHHELVKSINEQVEQLRREVHSRDTIDAILNGFSRQLTELRDVVREIGRDVKEASNRQWKVLDDHANRLTRLETQKKQQQQQRGRNQS